MSFNLLGSAQRFSNMTAALGMLSGLISVLIDTVEKAIPTAPGTSKFQHVLDGAKNALAIGGAALSDIEAIVPAVALGINQAVEVYKGRMTPDGRPIVPPPAGMYPIEPSAAGAP